MHMLSTMRSSNSIRPSYSAATVRQLSRKSPSDSFMMLALWTAVTLWRPLATAYSKANRAIRSDASRVMILMLSAASRPTMCSMPAYRSSVFSRTMTRSTSS